MIECFLSNYFCSKSSLFHGKMALGNFFIFLLFLKKKKHPNRDLNPVKFERFATKIITKKKHNHCKFYIFFEKCCNFYNIFYKSCNIYIGLKMREIITICYKR